MGCVACCSFIARAEWRGASLHLRRGPLVAHVVVGLLLLRSQDKMETVLIFTLRLNTMLSRVRDEIERAFENLRAQDNPILKLEIRALENFFNIIVITIDCETWWQAWVEIVDYVKQFDCS